MLPLQVVTFLSCLLSIYILLSWIEVSFNPGDGGSCNEDGGGLLSTSRVDNYTCADTRLSCRNSSTNLTFPFRPTEDPSVCKFSLLDLSCYDNRPLLQATARYDYNYFVDVDSIDYENQTFRVTDIEIQPDNCSTLPRSSSFEYFYRGISSIDQWVQLSLEFSDDSVILVFVSCKNLLNPELNSRYRRLVDTASCNLSSWNNHSFPQAASTISYDYVAFNLVNISEILDSCTINLMFPVSSNEMSVLHREGHNVSFQIVHAMLARGFKFRWEWKTDIIPNTWKIPFWCDLMARWNWPYHILLVLALVGSAKNIIGIILLLAFLIYKFRRRHLSMYDPIEKFLQSNNSFMPIRYSYREIKSMTNNFKEKIGEGGYGCVYKGKSRSGSLVAVKMLNKPKANEQEFINEVATIGRIHHVNVVRLVGFCVTSSKQALVYEYMPNGSLDKLIFSGTTNTVSSFSWEKAYEIAIGVARGIGYLHRGCDMQILHFDIKPHNILLDENSVPKVADFGLARLYSVQDENIATLTAIRGTIGYIAPELIYKNIGRVSYKADVYSFGMLLMDMAGRGKKVVDRNADRSSQMFFTSWIYNKMDRSEDIEFADDASDEDKRIAKKMVLTALWCIQMTPTDRPSMREVTEMLEGDVESLRLPPKPLLFPPDSQVDIQSISSSSSENSTGPLFKSLSLEIEELHS